MRARDNTEVGVRLGCGALFGLVLGLSSGSFLLGSRSALVGCVAACVVLCALAAWRFGDRFWMALRGLEHLVAGLWPWRRL